ncbi:MAG: ABC transporter ATP-binding protein [bacterium]
MALVGTLKRKPHKMELVGISKAFFDRDSSPLGVLENIEIRVEGGEFVSIIGPSGCGKSTLFNIASGLVHPDRGEIYIDGERVPDGRGLVAYMQQKDLLFPWRTVLDNAALSLEVQGTPRREARGGALPLLEKLGLSGFERAYPAQLSGGMRQRVALARTLLAGKDIMLLDEPFGALDAMTRAAMQRVLLKVWGEFGKTVLFITHDVEEALVLSDRIYVMTSRPGRIKDEVAVALPRPREVSDPRFVALKGRLLKLVHEEVEEMFDDLEKRHSAAI